MNNIIAVYIKQIQSLVKNPVMLVQAVLFLGLVFVITLLIGVDEEIDCDACIPAYVCAVCTEENTLDTPDPSMAALFTVMFVGLTLMGTASSLVTEDKTTNNLRFMTMAKVKPFQYLLGTGAALFSFVFIIIILFATVGGYFEYMLWFIAVTSFGALVSILLGTAIGLSKMPILAMPVSLVLGMGPMLSAFNETLANALRFTYTQQINLALSNVEYDMSSNFIVIGINGLVVLAFFIWMHRKGEMRW